MEQIWIFIFRYKMIVGKESQEKAEKEKVTTLTESKNEQQATSQKLARNS